MSYSHLVNRAKKLRQDTFTAFVEHGEAHLGGSFSMIEILISLFQEIMVNEDKFILSKAHASFPLCLVLKEKGLNPKIVSGMGVIISQSIDAGQKIEKGTRIELKAEIK